MNPVNLLPTKHRPRTPTGGQQGSAYIVVGILGVLLVMVVFYVLTINGVNSRRDQVAHAKAETADAQARATALGPYGDFSKIKEDRVNSVKQLAGGRIDWERLARGLARVLPNDVWLTSASASASGTPAAAGSGAPPSGATAAATAPTGPKVELIGCAASHSAVAVTLVRLRELSGAQDVQLNQITRPEPKPKGSGSNGTAAAGGSGGSGNGSDCGDLHGQPLAKWDATVSFNQNAGTSATGVPSSLGGGA